VNNTWGLFGGARESQFFIFPGVLAHDSATGWCTNVTPRDRRKGLLLLFNSMAANIMEEVNC